MDASQRVGSIRPLSPPFSLLTQQMSCGAGQITRVALLLFLSANTIAPRLGQTDTERGSRGETKKTSVGKSL